MLAVTVLLFEELATNFALELWVIGAAVSKHVLLQFPGCLETFAAYFTRKLDVVRLDAELFEVFRPLVLCQMALDVCFVITQVTSNFLFYIVALLMHFHL